MPVAYWASVVIHLLAAMLWLGGMLFLGVVGAPVLRGIEPASLRQRLFQELGERFRGVGWAAIATLVVTGTIALYYRGWLSVLDEPAFWRTPAGHALAGKLVVVTIMVTISAIHDFVHGPAAGRAAPGSPEALRLRRRAAVLARGNALLGVALVIAAVRLARG